MTRHSALPTLLALALAGCAGSAALPAPDRPAESDRVATDQPFELAIGHEASITGTGLRVRFVSVPEDSRCPTGVQCVWAGNARVVLRVAGTVTRDDTLSTTLPPASTRLDGVELTLVSLAPPPDRDRGVPRDAYRATLTARRR